MTRSALSRICSAALIVLSLVALLTVISGYLQPPQPHADEGPAAHLFQLSVAAYVLMLFVFSLTADWSKPLHSARSLLVSGLILALALELCITSSTTARLRHKLHSSLLGRWRIATANCTSKSLTHAGQA